MELEGEVNRLRGQIEEEHRASVWALTGLATGTSQHAFISRRMGHLERSYQRLGQLIGEEKAIGFLCQVFDTSPAQPVEASEDQSRLLTADRTRQQSEETDVLVYKGLDEATATA